MRDPLAEVGRIVEIPRNWAPVSPAAPAQWENGVPLSYLALQRTGDIGRQGDDGALFAARVPGLPTVARPFESER
jgi:hypothetical protein